MLRVFTLLLALFPRLARLFYLCRCPLFLCFSLVVFLWLLRVGFEFNLMPFWGYLSLVSHAFVCFIGSFEPSRTKLGRFFVYPMTKLLKTQRTS
jgi:hypothetical protein